MMLQDELVCLLRRSCDIWLIMTIGIKFSYDWLIVITSVSYDWLTVITGIRDKG